MNKILSRNEFSNEFERYKKDERVDEGLIQFFKSFFKKDWDKINSKNAFIKSELERIDKSLDGFSMLKRSNYDACATFRQSLCDFANDLLDSKLDELEKEQKKDSKSVLKKIVIGLDDDKESDDKKDEGEKDENIDSIVGEGTVRDKALIEKLKNSAKEINDAIANNPSIAPWANTMKRMITNVINDAIIAKSDADDKEEIQKALDAKKKDDEEWLKNQNNLNYKTEKEKISSLEKARERILTSIGVTPLKGVDGNKAYKQLKQEFDNMYKELDAKFSNVSEAKKSNTFMDEIDEIIKNDFHFGFKNIVEIIKNNYKEVKTLPKTKDIISIYFKELDNIYKSIKKINKNKEDVFADVPGDAMQAMYAALAITVAYGITGLKDFVSKDNLDLIARCCIEKDATLGYSFPLVDEKDPKIGTIYVAIMGKLQEGKDEAGIFKDSTETKNLLNVFKKNIQGLYNLILKTVESLKKKKEEQDEKESKALKEKEKMENNKKEK